MSAELYFLYDQVLENLSRLSVLTKSRTRERHGSDVRGDVEHITDLLARRDLLMLASSVRNFAETTKSTSAMKEQKVLLWEPFLSAGPPFFHRTKKRINLYQAANRVLHTTSLELLHTPSAFIKASSLDLNEFARRIFQEKNDFPDFIEPMVVATTEQDGPSAFQLSDLLGATIDFLDIVVDQLAEQKTFIERSMRDY